MLVSAADSPMTTLRWRDHHLRYEGYFVSDGSGLSISVSVFDAMENTAFGKIDIPNLEVVPLNDTDAKIAFEIQMKGDRGIGNSHAHPIYLVMRYDKSDRTQHLIQSCRSQSECYQAGGVVTGKAAAQMLRLGKELAKRRRQTEIEEAKQEQLERDEEDTATSMEIEYAQRRTQQILRQHQENMKSLNDTSEAIIHMGQQWCEAEQQWRVRCR